MEEEERPCPVSEVLDGILFQPQPPTSIWSYPTWHALGDYVAKATTERIVVEAVRRQHSGRPKSERDQATANIKFTQLAQEAEVLPKRMIRLEKRLLATQQVEAMARVALVPEIAAADGELERVVSNWWAAAGSRAFGRGLAASPAELLAAAVAARCQALGPPQEVEEALRAAALQLGAALQVQARQRAAEEAKRLRPLVGEAAAQLPPAVAAALRELERPTKAEQKMRKSASAVREAAGRMKELGKVVAGVVRPLKEAVAREAAARSACSRPAASKALLQRLRPSIDELSADCEKLRREVDGTCHIVETALASQDPPQEPPPAAPTDFDDDDWAADLGSGRGWWNDPWDTTSSNKIASSRGGWGRWRGRRSSPADLAWEEVAPRSSPPWDSLAQEPDPNSIVVINCANVGHTYTESKGGSGFDWEGVRRCFSFYDQKGVIPQGVCTKWIKSPIPDDLKPRVIVCPQDREDLGKDIDDLFTIRIAMHYGCQLVDNDNYRDWKNNLEKSSQDVQKWLNGVGQNLKVTFVFDVLGNFIPVKMPRRLAYAPRHG